MGFSAFTLAAHAQDAPIYKSIYDSAKAKFDKGEYIEARALFLEVKRMALEEGTYGETIDFRIAQCYEMEGNNKEAIKSYTIYVKGNAINDKVASRETVERKIKELENKLAQESNVALQAEKAKKTVADLYKRADEYVSKGNFTSALALYLEVRDIAVRANIFQEIVDYKIAHCYHQQKAYSDAIKYYKLYVSAPTIQKGWPDRVRIQRYIEDLEKYLEKEASSTASLVMDAKTKNYWTEGQTRYRQNQFAQARKYFEMAKSHMQESQNYSEWIEYFIGISCEAENKPADAIAAYKLYVASKTTFNEMPTKEEVGKMIERLEKSLVATSNPSTTVLTKKLEQMHQQARRLAAEGKFGDARTLLLAIKKDAVAAKIYHHKMDWDIAVTYDREGTYTLAIQHYNIYLDAPAIQPGWPDRYAVQNRVQFLKEEQGSKGGSGSFSGGGYYGDGGGPSILGPADSITGKWWFWVGVAVVGVIVIAVVASGSQQQSDDGYKSRPVGFGGDPVNGPGLPVLRF